MQTVGFITEYNPFHNGHLYHLRQAKERTGAKYSVAVMSGHFTQRGEAAIFDKWRRAEMAVNNGVDLVIELPVAWAVRSAQFFAQGGIRLLSSLGVVDAICFGAEINDMDRLNVAAAALTEPAVVQHLRQLLHQGLSYAAAVARAIQRHTGITALDLSQPNTILALEYLRSLRLFAPHITPVVIPRQQAAFHDREIRAPIASATAIRQIIYKHGLAAAVAAAVPPASLAVMAQAINDGCGPVQDETFDNIIMYKIRTTPLFHLASLPESGEGLYYKLARTAATTGSMQTLLQHLKTKRYPWTRLRRLLTYVLLDLRQRQLLWADAYGPQYIRVLAFNDNGRLLLRRMRDKATLPVIVKTARYLTTRTSGQGLTVLQRMLAMDTRATDIYVQGFPDCHKRVAGRDFTCSPVYVRSRGMG